jgi:hypothetical protein
MIDEVCSRAAFVFLACSLEKGSKNGIGRGTHITGRGKLDGGLQLVESRVRV